MKKVANLLTILLFCASTYATNDEKPQQKDLSTPAAKLSPAADGFSFDWRKGVYQRKISENFVGVSSSSALVLKNQRDLSTFALGSQFLYQHRFFNGIALGGGFGFNYFFPEQKSDNRGEALQIEDNHYNPFFVTTLTGNFTYYALRSHFFHPYIGLDAGIWTIFGNQDGFFKNNIWEHPAQNNFKYSRLGIHLAPHLGCMIEMGQDWRFTIDASAIYIPNGTFTDTYHWTAGALEYKEEITVNTGILIAPSLNVGFVYSL